MLLIQLSFRCNIKLISYFVLGIESFQRGTETERAAWHVGNLIDDSKQSIFRLLVLDGSSGASFLTPAFDSSFHQHFPCLFSPRTPAGVFSVAAERIAQAEGIVHCYSVCLGCFWHRCWLLLWFDFIVLFPYFVFKGVWLLWPQSADAVIHKHYNMFPSGKCRCPKQVFGLF